MSQNQYKNIAIIAHVDHGKTTLIDALLTQSGTFRDNEKIGVCMMDSNDQEKERGITIYAKNTSVFFDKCKINIVDTPGHADFSSEVERSLNLVDSVLLLVDAYEGPMPQTKFVLKKALEHHLKPIVVINKIDKDSARVEWVIDQLLDLFIQLGADDDQLDFVVCYAAAKKGIAKLHMSDESDNIQPLFKLIMEKVKSADFDTQAPFKMQVTNLEYDNFLGRMAIGRILEGKINKNQNVVVTNKQGEKRKAKISEVLTTEGLSKIKVTTAYAGDIVILAGISDIDVGETIAENEKVEALEPINIDEPTLKMEFLVNDSPFAGRQGKYVTSRQIRDRLEKELETNVGMKIEFSNENNSEDSFVVCGRGELHLSVLIETMRREDFELQVGAPEVIIKEIDGKKLEPIERAFVSVPSEFSGKVIEKISKLKGEMQNLNEENNISTMEFLVPSRGLLGFRSEFITLTKGEGILASNFEEYVPYKGEIAKREVGSMISSENGTAMAYSLWNLQERGPLFIDPAIEVYEGMIIGEHLKGGDLNVNPCKNKKLSNVRASGKDEAIKLTVPHKLTLEEAISYIGSDEYVEVTPENIRLRKKYLKEHERRKARKS